MTTYVPNHWLPGSTSPVLMATGLVSEKGRICPPTKSTPSTNNWKICHR